MWAREGKKRKKETSRKYKGFRAIIILLFPNNRRKKRNKKLSPGCHENKVEGGGARSDGGETERPQSADVSCVHQREARVDQHGSQRRERQREDLAVENMGSRSADHCRANLTPGSGSSPHTNFPADKKKCFGITHFTARPTKLLKYVPTTVGTYKQLLAVDSAIYRSIVPFSTAPRVGFRWQLSTPVRLYSPRFSSSQITSPNPNPKRKKLLWSKSSRARAAAVLSELYICTCEKSSQYMRTCWY